MWKYFFKLIFKRHAIEENKSKNTKCQYTVGKYKYPINVQKNSHNTANVH